MTDPGPRLLRTLSIPLGIVLVFLLFTPKLCHRAIAEAEARHAATDGQPSPESHAGLVIESTTPAPKSAELDFPSGLDAARIEYLVEIDEHFARGSTMAVTENAPITPELLRLKYVEKNDDGSFTPTSDGLINVNGASDSADGWSVPIARRTFAGVLAIENLGGGEYHVTIRWRWEPSAVGAAILPRPTDHQAVADFAGSDGHWALASWVQEPDSLLH